MNSLIPETDDAAVTFVAYGHPQPGGSKTSFVPLDKRRTSSRWPRGEPYADKKGGTVVSTADSNAKVKPWRAVIAEAARRAYRGPLFDGPLAVDFVFVAHRPAGHYGTGRNAGQLKRSAPSRPAVRPDVLKLARAAEDALSGVLWVDDALITTERLDKVYGTVSCCIVRVRRDDGGGAPEWASRLIADEPY